jgi:hypothetical protein
MKRLSAQPRAVQSLPVVLCLYLSLSPSVSGGCILCVRPLLSLVFSVRLVEGSVARCSSSSMEQFMRDQRMNPMIDRQQEVMAMAMEEVMVVMG